MIRPINIKLNAAHPELPLIEATTFTGAPSSVFIRGVPKNCGNWSITAVNVAVTYPDNSTTTRAAVESAEGVWVATIPGTATSGRTVAGFRILADGIDENGAAVTGYVLGFADFAVLSFFPVPAPGETFFYLRYFDTMPTAAKKMDVTTIDGVLKYYNGAAWLPFTDLSNYYTKAETDNAIERVAAYYITYTAAGAAFPTRAALLNATVVYSGGATRTPTRNDYAVVLADESHGGAEWRYIYTVAAGATSGQWDAQYPIETNDYDGLSNKPQINGVSLSGNKTGADLGVLDLSGGTITGTLFCESVVQLSNGGPLVIGGGAQAPDGVTVETTGTTRWSGGTTYTQTIPLKNGTYALSSDIDAAISPTSPAFSNAVLSVGLGIDTDTVAVINELVDSAHDLPVSGATSVGALLLALAAAVAALKKKFGYDIVYVETTGTTSILGSFQNRAVNVVTLGSAVTSATFTFPAKSQGKSRDFFVRLVIQGTTPPTISFVEPGGGAVSFDSAGDQWAAIDTGINIIMFTDTAE